MIVSVSKFKKEKQKFDHLYNEYLDKCSKIEKDLSLNEISQECLLDNLAKEYNGYTNILDFEYECIITEEYLKDYDCGTKSNFKWIKSLLPYYNKKINNETLFVGVIDSSNDFFYMVEQGKNTIYYSFFNENFIENLKEAFNL